MSKPRRKSIFSRGREFARQAATLGILALAAGALVADRLIERRQAAPTIDEVTLDWLPAEASIPVRGFAEDYWPTRRREVVRPYRYVHIAPQEAQDMLAQGKSMAVISTTDTIGQRRPESRLDRRLVIACQNEQGEWQVAQSTQLLTDAYPETSCESPDIVMGVPIGPTGLTMCIGELMPDDYSTFAGHETVCNEFLSPQDFAYHYAGQAVQVKV